MRDFNIPWTVDEPTSRDNIVISDSMGYVASLVPFDPESGPDGETLMRVAAQDLCDVVNDSEEISRYTRKAVKAALATLGD